MNNKPRTRSLLLSVLLAFSLIATACGDNDESSSGDSSSGDVELADDAPEPAAGDDEDAAEPEPEDDGDDAAEPEPEASSVRIAGDGFLLGTQAWISQDQGYFAENNVEADVSLFGTGIEAIQGVIARQADLGHALDFAVLSLVAAADENMQIVGAIATPDPGFHSLAVRNEITDETGLAGQKIGYVEGTSEHFVTIRHLQQLGISLDDVELVPLPGLFELVGALKTNEIQAAWTWLDGTAQANDDPDLTVLRNDVGVLDTVAIYMIAEASWAADNQLAIERVLRSYDQASAFIADDAGAAAEIVADAVSGNADLFANTIPNQHFGIEFNQTMLDSLDAIATFLVERGTLDADFDVREFLSLDAMEAAVPGSITADTG